jgi:glycerol uptake facilitator-like aquaporin
MTLLGAILLNLFGLLLILWVLNLVRLGRLYVGFAIVLLCSILTTLGVASVPPARAMAARLLHALFPGAEAVVLMGAAFFLILIYVLAQITRLVNRLATIVQELALRDAEQGRTGEQRAAARDAGPERE